MRPWPLGELVDVQRVKELPFRPRGPAQELPQSAVVAWREMREDREYSDEVEGLVAEWQLNVIGKPVAFRLVQIVVHVDVEVLEARVVQVVVEGTRSSRGRRQLRRTDGPAAGSSRAPG
jgi:hypothetical protein